MRQAGVFLLVLVIHMAVVFSISGIGTAGVEVREPVWSGIFYPENKEDIAAAIDKYSALAARREVEIPPRAHLKALIMPHAGFEYSGYTAAFSSLILDKKRYTKVILMGPDHGVGMDDCAVSDVEAYRTPLGTVPLHRDARFLRRAGLCRASIMSDRSEHSLEVVLPFLQKYLGSFTLVPVVVGRVSVNYLADSVDTLMDSATLLVASSDLSHSLPYDRAVAQDLQTIRLVLEMNVPELMAGKNRACGVRSVSVLLALAQKYGWQPRLLNYSNSGLTAGTKDEVTGYAVIAFFGEKRMEKRETQEFASEQGRILALLARQTILEKFNRQLPSDKEEMLAQALKDPVFDKQRDVFVTLTINGQLRGCIGSLEGGTESVREGVRRNALNAAFSDYRFKPLSPDEVDKIDIEVSILTKPRSMQYSEGEELAAKLRPGVDGVILGMGHFSATFLPQVWDQLPRVEDFLGHLCSKAGLAPDAWRRNKLQVQTYQAQYFHE